MKAKIKKGIDLEKLIDFGFAKISKPRGYFKSLSEVHGLFVNKKSRRLYVTTPMGVAAFMESHIDKYQDLYDMDIVEFIDDKYSDGVRPCDMKIKKKLKHAYYGVQSLSDEHEVDNN